ncbi:DUF927 domain-containing protein [Macrococcus capreoli]|uniref:DUF927 domain-containing protein n=1 Tax=Macrococcus capreoli TaxID=2982690 RepID=UPI0021D60AF0|nr:DUF927 domain-containing protein [Macrococcus sp. TMW 2.2395]MCU7557963.1 DUF927 domain-containing protein [Macrococcus sp. TMW 2.2395]
MENISKYGEYELDTNGWHKYHITKSENRRINFAPYIIITHRFKNVSSREEELVITDSFDTSVKESADILMTSNLPNLIKKGFTINHKYLPDLSLALQLMRNSIQPTIQYKEIGLIPNHDEPLILLNKSYSPIQLPYTPVSSSQLMIQPNGNLDDWMKMFDTHVMGNHKLELATVIGISGLVNAFMNKEGVSPIKSLMFHLVGNSSSGKTTSAMLALSTAGSPNNETTSLYKNWNATPNSIITAIADNYGIPILFDEVSMVNTNSLTSTIYSITDGREKSRLNQDGTAKQVRTWNTAIISTGEYSILNSNKTAKNDGLNVRVIELDNPWTTSSHNSDEIKKIVKKHYGHILPLVADFLITGNFHEIVKSYDYFKSIITEKLANDKSNTGTRMSDYYAIILLSAKILEHVLDRKLQLSMMIDELIQYHWNTLTNRNLAEKAIDTITQFVLTNNAYFSRNKWLNNGFTNYGFINYDEKNGYIKTDILKDVFHKMLINHNYQDKNVVIKALLDEGYLITQEKDRNTTRHGYIDGSGQRKKAAFYSLKLDASHAEAFGYSTNHSQSNISSELQEVFGTMKSDNMNGSE